jgi:hypothetical protein
MIDFAELRSTIESAGGTPGCDVCGFTELEIREVPIQPDVLTLVCPKCAAIQLYSHPHLERLLERGSQ